MLIHRFYLDELSQNPAFDYRLYYEKTADASLHDDLIQYINDSLQWVSSYNPARNMEAQSGLNHHGPTVIRSSGAKKLRRVSMAWASLFAQSPPKLELTGDFCWVNDQNPENGSYVKLDLIRDQVVANFEDLAEICLKVADSDDSAFIMHYGL